MTHAGTDREADTGSQPLVPTWVRGNTNLFAMLVAGVVVGLGLFLISWLSPVLAPLGLGLFLAALAAPLFTWLEARGRSAALALTLTVGIVLVVGAALVLLALSGAASLADGLVTYSDALEARYPNVSDATAANLVVSVLGRILPADVLIDVLRAVSGFGLTSVPCLGLVLAMIPPTILVLAESGPLAAAAVVSGGTALNLIAE